MWNILLGIYFYPVIFICGTSILGTILNGLMYLYMDEKDNPPFVKGIYLSFVWPYFIFAGIYGAYRALKES